MPAYIDALLFVLSGMLFILSFYVFTHNRENPTSQAFAALFASGSLWSFSIAMFLTTPSALTGYLWAWMIYLSGSFSASSFLWFASVFPHEPQRFSVSRLFLILFPVYFFPLLIYSKGFILSIDIVTRSVNLGPLYIVWMLVFLSFFTVSFALLVQSYHKASGIQKEHLRYILYSLIIPGTAASLFNIIFPLFDNFRFIWIGPLFLSAMIIMISIAVGKYQFMDIKILSHDFLTKLVAIILFSSMSGAAALLYGIISGYPVHTAVVFPIVGAMTMVVFSDDAIMSLSAAFVGTFILKGSYEPELLFSRLTHIASSTINSSKMLTEISSVLSDGLHVKFVGFILRNTNPSNTGFLTRYSYFGTGRITPDQYHNLFSYMFHQDTDTECISGNTVHANTPQAQEVATLLRQAHVAFIYPLRVSGQLIGIMIIGEKHRLEYFSVQDRDVLGRFATQATFAIENSRLFSETEKFNSLLTKEVEHATEELRHKVRALRRANSKLLELDKLKNEFVSLASHELRTPMTTISNYVWMILEGKAGKTNPKQTEYLKKVAHSARRLNQQIKDMLTISKIEAGKLEITKTQCDIKALAHVHIEEFKSEAAKKNIKLSVNPPLHHLPPVYLDKDKINEVLANLMENAIKFTPRGGSVSIQLEQKGHTIKISVQDTGPGIQKDDISKLFSKFGRLAHSYATIAESTGTGLGLYISREIIKAHGGEIGVSSNPPHGSTFWITLPLSTK